MLFLSITNTWNSDYYSINKIKVKIVCINWKINKTRAISMKSLYTGYNIFSNYTTYPDVCNSIDVCNAL